MKHGFPCKAVCLLLICALLLPLVGCASTGEPLPQAVDLMQKIAPSSGEIQPVSQEAAAAAADFALRLFQTGNDPSHNTLISPLSVLCALAMCANGADGATLTQMESTLGLRRDLYNEFFRSYLAALRKGDALKLANSVWFTDRTGFTVDLDFLQTNADFYGADAYLAPFDEGTLAEMNGWVKENTDGMIPEILDELPDDAVMYLINALAFEAAWNVPYSEHAVQQGTFTTADGETRTVDFLHSKEGVYLEDEQAVGFLKYYEGRRYAFVALLPNEGVSLADYLAGFDGASLRKLLSERAYTDVDASMPKFEADWSGELSAILKNMGMTLPFDKDQADLSGIGTSQIGKLCISRVLHKTYISVTEQGTKAGAATAIEMTEAGIELEEPKQVFLDRPFVYLLIDCENDLPLFIGTMLDPAE